MIVRACSMGSSAMQRIATAAHAAKPAPSACARAAPFWGSGLFLKVARDVFRHFGRDCYMVHKHIISAFLFIPHIHRFLFCDSAINQS